MTESLLILIYFIGCFLAVFPISWAFSTDFGSDDPDTESIVFGTAMGLCGCWFWPLLVFPGVPVFYAVKHWGK